MWLVVPFVDCVFNLSKVELGICHCDLEGISLLDEVGGLLGDHVSEAAVHNSDHSLAIFDGVRAIFEGFDTILGEAEFFTVCVDPRLNLFELFGDIGNV